MTDDVRRTIDAIFRLESAKVIASVARSTRDVGLAEELAQDALVAALEQWPTSGLPDNPGAWLVAVAKNRALDAHRRTKMLQRKHSQMIHDPDDHATVSEPDSIADDTLRLVFTACHPVLTVEARVALTLKMLGGLTTNAIARAFLVSEDAIAQRIVRAKRTLADAHVGFESPTGGERDERLASVLEVVYLVFNEGYAATAGSDWMRPALCEDALRLGRMLAELAPREPEVHALVALMELHASRTRARTSPDGEPILLLDQNRARWDQVLVRRGLAALARSESLGARRGTYALQAAIVACHARAKVASQTDWKRIASLYGDLERVEPSPVVALNRAVAVSMAEGPAAGLAIVDALRSDSALARYHLLPSARGDMLQRLGRTREARAEFERAASLTKNERERVVLLARARACV